MQYAIVAFITLTLSACTASTYTIDEFLAMKEKCESLGGTATEFANKPLSWYDNGLTCVVYGVPFKIK